MSVITKPNVIRRFINSFREQRGIVGDALDSLFNKGVVKQPRDLNAYRTYYEEDATVGTSVDTLSEMVIGPDIYVTIKNEDDSATKAAKEEIDSLNEKIRLQENLLNVDKCMNIFGFCPVERIIKVGGYPPPGGISGLMVLDPPTVTYQREPNGTVKGYTQTVESGKPIPFKPDDLIWFTNNQAGNARGSLYGTSRIKRVIKLLDIRDQVIQNIEGIMRNQARPPIVWRVNSEGDVQTLKGILKECKDAETDPVVFPANAIQFDVVKTETRASYWEYVPYIDGLIFQGLHAPMLDYLRNATEASANTMLEVIERHVEGRQRYIKRMVETEIYSFHLKRKMPEYVRGGGEIPSLHFGAPKNALDDLDVAPFLTEGLKQGMIDNARFTDILRQKGLTLATPQPEPNVPQGAVKVTTGANQVTTDANQQKTPLKVVTGEDVEYRVVRKKRNPP